MSAPTPKASPISPQQLRRIETVCYERARRATNDFRSPGACAFWSAYHRWVKRYRERALPKLKEV
jgi:hypothetical protein